MAIIIVSTGKRGVVWFTWESSSQLKTDGGAQSLVGVDAQGRPRSNEGHGQMRQEVGKV